MQKAIIYARVSPKGSKGHKTGQAIAAESLENQIAIIRSYCEKSGYEIASVFTDEYRSGDDEEREGLWGAVEAIRRGYVLVAWRYERLARSVFLEEVIKREVTRNRGRIEVVDGHRGNTPEDDLVRGILACVAQYEKRVIAARTKIHMLKRQQSGQAMGSRAPMGTAIVDGKLVPNEAEIRQMRLALELKRQGDGFRTIARKLNHQGERFRGGRFHHSTIRRGLDRWLQGGLPFPAPESE